ncbi:MAG: hypothetical protein M1522_02305 [Actinobacteria bacterium]|nr:hypothetical protein [Actinomycetota bacterium]
MMRKVVSPIGALSAVALTIGLGLASASPASATVAACPLGTVAIPPGSCRPARPIPASVEAHGVRYVLPVAPPTPTPGFPPLGAAAIGVVGGAGLAEAVRRLVARRRAQ